MTIEVVSVTGIRPEKRRKENISISDMPDVLKKFQSNDISEASVICSKGSNAYINSEQIIKQRIGVKR